MSTSDAVTLVSKLDFGDPLYLHASDITSTPLITIKLKGTENYKVWCTAMKLALQTKNKWGFIDKTCVKNDDDEVVSKQWERCNSVVLSWILNCVSEELYLGQIFSENAAVVWQKLKETYDKVDKSIIYNIHHQINSISQNGLSISEYYHKLNSLWKQFDALTTLSTSSEEIPKAYVDHSNMIKLMQFLMGLDEVYAPIRSNILTSENEVTVKTAFAIISREESHRGLGNRSSSGSTAFIAKFQNNRTFNKGPNPNFKCTKCGMIGHTVDRCFEIIGYPPGFKKRTDF
ncbi:uncharacterized protein [Rutidosis leptorrhynchoides]|uniref:uncharacterized protein n=1 Tax=Rutidosis leptorrhynchoides TaxID=125765 RepID=UPI003A9A4EDF